MKSFLKETVNTEEIDKVNIDELKDIMMGDNNPMATRIKYRKQVGLANKQKSITKGQVIKYELLSAAGIEDKHKNEHFGFSCLHYSVSEGSGSICI
jgi:hypothetical protein